MVQESSRFIWKNLTIFIFFLIAIINLIIVYLLWPYLSVWLPENSLFAVVVDNANTFIRHYVSQFMDRSATIFLLVIIAISLFVLLGRDEMLNGWNKITKRLSI